MNGATTVMFHLDLHRHTHSWLGRCQGEQAKVAATATCQLAAPLAVRTRKLGQNMATVASICLPRIFAPQMPTASCDCARPLLDWAVRQHAVLHHAELQRAAATT
jgi:hypothetical protein